jgi:3-methyladenine DNA glycosylase/8-oxoguanine DNA glycosylase
MTLVLPYRPPYEWAGILRFLAARAIPGVEQVTPGGYARTIALGPAEGWIEVAQGEGDTLAARVHGLDGAALPVIAARIRRIFDLDADPALIGAHLSTDPQLAPLVEARPGLRVPGAWDGFELAMRAILGQQITVAAATRLAGKLVTTCGTRLAAAPAGLDHIFPSPDRLDGVNLSLTLGMPRSRGATMAAMARAALADPDLFMPGPDLAAGVARLIALPGIGPWTAHYIAMRALREPDAFPTGDIGLLRAMQTLAGRPTAAALLARAEAWRPWRAYAALHLWASEPPASLAL